MKKAWICLCAAALAGQSTFAQSVYVLRNHHECPAPIVAYRAENDGSLTYQDTYGVRCWEWGGSGIAVWLNPDHNAATVDARAFLSYENSNRLEMFETADFTNLGSAEAPGTTDVTGIVVDDLKDLLYAVSRRNNQLYVYRLLEEPPYIELEKQLTLPTGNNFGIALDEQRSRLYVASNLPTVHFYDTDEWDNLGSGESIRPAGAISACHQAIAIAVDVRRNLVYTGASFVDDWRLCRYDMNMLDADPPQEPTVHSVLVGDREGAMGIAVSRRNSLIYVSTGPQSDTRRGDHLHVYDPDLNLLHSYGGQNNWNPAGIIAISGFSPIRLAKQCDREASVSVGQDITYTLTFDTKKSLTGFHQVRIVDHLPAEVEFVSASDDLYTYSYNAAEHRVTWEVGDLPAGSEPQDLEITGRIARAATPGKEILNSAQALSVEEENPTEELYPDPDDPAEPPLLVIPEFIRGDVNADGKVNIADAIYLLNDLFRGGPRTPCDKTADADDNSGIQLADALYIINHRLLQGPAPPEPYPLCGGDGSVDALTCDSYDICR